jgi:hypothetical protein
MPFLLAGTTTGFPFFAGGDALGYTTLLSGWFSRIHSPPAAHPVAACVRFIFVPMSGDCGRRAG